MHHKDLLDNNFSARFTFNLSTISLLLSFKNSIIIPSNQITQGSISSNTTAVTNSIIENHQNRSNNRPTSPENISGAKATPFVMAGNNVTRHQQQQQQQQLHKNQQKNKEQRTSASSSSSVLTVKLDSKTQTKTKTTSKEPKTQKTNNISSSSSSKGLFGFTRSKSSLSYRNEHTHSV